MPDENIQMQKEAERLFAELSAKNFALTGAERAKLPLQAMPSQDPLVRRGKMGEVALGYSVEQVRIEASRCLSCKNQPCREG